MQDYPKNLYLSSARRLDDLWLYSDYFAEDAAVSYDERHNVVWWKIEKVPYESVSVSNNISIFLAKDDGRVVGGCINL